MRSGDELTQRGEIRAAGGFYLGGVGETRAFTVSTADGLALANLYAVVATGQNIATCDGCGATYGKSIKSSVRFCSDKCRHKAADIARRKRAGTYGGKSVSKAKTR